MPESKKRRKVVDREATKARTSSKKVEKVDQHSPRWYAPLMVTLAIIGLIIVVTAYVTNGGYPFPFFSNGNYNLFIGIGLMLVGFLMTMGWK